MQEAGTTAMVVRRYAGGVSINERLYARRIRKAVILDWHEKECKKTCPDVNRDGGCKLRKKPT